MNKNIKDWIDKINEEEGSEYSIYDYNEILMQRWLNSNIKHLEAKILGYRQKIKYYSPATDGFLKEYDEWFGITTDREEKI